MGTSSLTVVYDRYNEPVLGMAQHCDGQLYAYGVELAAFLCAKQIVNGIPSGDTSALANGMGCLAAQLVVHFKQGCGGIYLVPPQAWEHHYVYHIMQHSVEVLHHGGRIFNGTWEQFATYCNSNPLLYGEE